MQKPLCFNPRSHEGSDASNPVAYALFRMFQSTLPRRERRKDGREIEIQNNGFNPRSHEGSDYRPSSTRGRRRVSIHAPTKGATGAPCGQATEMEVSIHAPTKGATGLYLEFPGAWICFNPRSHEGSDVESLNFMYGCAMFQSTLPRRERRPPGVFILSPNGFNPRSHEGSDRFLQPQLQRLQEVSIHAPTKGATVCLVLI